jgi:hypothetical protein
MDFLTFVSNLIETIAWPSVVIAILVLFRTPITELINAIKEAKFKITKGETTIEGELNTVRKKMGEVKATSVPEKVEKLIAKSPQKAIESSWDDLVQTTSASLSLSTAAMAPLKMADTLVEERILSESEAEAFFKLYEIKDELLKPDSRFITDVSSASNYSSLAYALSDKIKEKKT